MSTDTVKYGGKAQTIEANTGRIGVLVGMAAEQVKLTTTGEKKIRLNDVELVKQIAIKYLLECAGAGALPTVRGVASRLGVSRNALYDFAARHPDGALAKWLEDFSDMCGEITMQAALEGAVAAVPAIFVAKSRYGWREAPAQIEISTPKYGPLGGKLSVGEIAERYADLPGD